MNRQHYDNLPLRSDNLAEPPDVQAPAPSGRHPRLRVGFEASHLLHPDGGGIYTYTRELVKHLSIRDDLALTYIEAATGPSRSEPSADGPSAAEAIRARTLVPFLGATRGRWRKDYRTRRAVHLVDALTAVPLSKLVDVTPLTARFRLPAHIRGALDVYHWSDWAFVNLPGAAHVVTLHDLIVLRTAEWHTPEDARHHSRRIRKAAGHATRIIADSENTRRDAELLLGIEEDKIDVVPLAAGRGFTPSADAAEQTTVLEKYDLEDDGYILYVGTLEPRKNVVRLAEGFKRAIDSLPSSAIRLVLVGKRGWMTEGIDRGLESVGLGERLALLGHVPEEDLPRLMQCARAFAYLSLYEGFGLPPLEAMACGAPVVASNTSSIPEVTGEAALLVDPLNVREIGEALARVIDDDHLCAQLACEGLKRSGIFSWGRTAQLTVETYERALAQVRKRRLTREALR